MWKDGELVTFTHNDESIHKFKIKTVGIDGNCFYRAIAQNETSNEESYNTIRDDMVTFLNKQIYGKTEDEIAIMCKLDKTSFTQKYAGLFGLNDKNQITGINWGCGDKDEGTANSVLCISLDKNWATLPGDALLASLKYEKPVVVYNITNDPTYKSVTTYGITDDTKGVIYLLRNHLFGKDNTTGRGSDHFDLLIPEETEKPKTTSAVGIEKIEGTTAKGSDNETKQQTLFEQIRNWFNTSYNSESPTESYNLKLSIRKGGTGIAYMEVYGQDITTADVDKGISSLTTDTAVFDKVKVNIDAKGIMTIIPDSGVSSSSALPNSSSSTSSSSSVVVASPTIPTSNESEQLTEIKLAAQQAAITADDSAAAAKAFVSGEAADDSAAAAAAENADEAAVALWKLLGINEKYRIYIPRTII